VTPKHEVSDRADVICERDGDPDRLAAVDLRPRTPSEVCKRRDEEGDLYHCGNDDSRSLLG
jgi:hypothetical protein